MKGKPGKTYRTGFGDASASPAVDLGACTKCGLCIRFCPSGTLRDRDGDGAPVVEIDRGSGCIGCGHCMSVCAHGAIGVTGRRIAPSDSFPLPPAGERAGADALFGLLASRRSIRRFKEQEVDRAVLDRVIETAGLAPMGLPPWDVGVTVIDGREKVRRFARDTVGAFRKMLAPMGVMLPLLRLSMDRAQYESLRDFVLPVMREIVEDHARGVDHLFYDAPCVMLFHGIPGSEADGIIACTYAMVAAQALGLGSCMIGTVAPFLNREKRVAAAWGVPKGDKLALALILGHPAVRPTRGIRRRFAGVRYA
jgi:ferredoxin